MKRVFLYSIFLLFPILTFCQNNGHHIQCGAYATVDRDTLYLAQDDSLGIMIGKVWRTDSVSHYRGEQPKLIFTTKSHIIRLRRSTQYKTEKQ